MTDFKETEPLFSVIVPVYDVPVDVFKKCLMSIADQDYANLEVIIVANGGDREAERLAKEFSGDRANWTVLFTEEKGACQARNLGFKQSKGDIVSFTNSDYILKIGTIRMWVDTLLAHPACGFVYGAYEYTMAERQVYWSKPFDVFQLEVANYIDCGFPLWRKHVVAWDENVKSLQDWDFWLRVVKSGVKGHFLGREISFLAEPPRQKGLSHDSTDNWKDRVKFIKEKNGIPARDICVTSIGAPNHGIEIAKMLGADFRDDTLHKPHDYKALYLIGWYMKPGEAQNGHSAILRRFPNSKRIVHFVGADIYWLRHFSHQQIREWAGAMRLTVHHFLTENEAAQGELRSYGIDSEVVPIPPYSDFSIKPLPEEFAVALYLTDKSDFDKYLQNHTLSIVKAMPDVKFYGYGDAQLNGFLSKNFEHKGFLPRPEWEKLVYNCSAYLRLVKHDTRPLASDEFIMAGRSVITNIPAPHMNIIDTSGTEPFDAWDQFSPGFNPYRWPDTKKKIIQEIRKVRDHGVPLEVRAQASTEFNALLDKQVYRETIHRFSQPESIKLEVVNA